MRKNHAVKWGDPYDYRGFARLDELFMILRSNLMIRRRKRDVLEDLPLKQRFKTPLAARKEQVDFPKDESQASKFTKTCEFGQMNIDNMREKIKYIPKYLDDIVFESMRQESGKKIILFGYYREMLDCFQECTENSGFGFMRIDGKVDKSLRGGLIDRYQNDPNCRVAILSTPACCAGITLTKGTEVYFGDLPMSPDQAEQAEARVHRIGQILPVSVYYLMITNSIDEMLWGMLRKKTKVFGNAIDNERRQFNASTLKVDGDYDDDDIALVVRQRNVGGNKRSRDDSMTFEERSTKSQKVVDDDVSAYLDSIM
jgi:SWI/SNF-related matrix-associated actin-dependent regulator 1 of chromatin subfamily A